MAGSRKEVGLSLLSAAIQTKREVMQMMENNFACLQTKIANDRELKIPTHGNTDKELWALLIHQKNSGGTGDNYTDQFDEKGEKEHPSTTPTNSPKPQTPKMGGKGKGEKGENINYTTAINKCTTTQCHPMYTTTHCNHHCSPS